MATPTRETVDLSAWPDLVVIYLGMRVRSLRGFATLLRFGPRIAAAVDEQPDGLLLHESVLYGLFPPHFGMRQYWRDLASLERWTRESAHGDWWRSYLRDAGGTGFWHETYTRRGGFESVFIDVPVPLGLAAFAPREAARGRMFGARSRLARGEEGGRAAPLGEADLYSEDRG
jgi:hypothetical protein